MAIKPLQPLNFQSIVCLDQPINSIFWVLRSVMSVVEQVVEMPLSLDIGPVERKDDDGSSWMELSFLDDDGNDSKSSFAAHSALSLSAASGDECSVESSGKKRGMRRALSMPLGKKEDKPSSRTRLSASNSFSGKTKLKLRGVKKTSSYGGTRSGNVESTLARRRMLRRVSLSDSISSSDSLDNDGPDDDHDDDASVSSQASKSSRKGRLRRQISSKAGRYIGLKELAKKGEQSDDRRSLVANALYASMGDDDDDDYLASSILR